MSEEPDNVMTEFMTTGERQTEEKTRFISTPQFEWTFSTLIAGETLNLPMLREMASTHMRMMMAYKGMRSDDIVTCLANRQRGDMKSLGIPEVKSYIQRRNSSDADSGP